MNPGSALVEGPKYDFPRVLGAYERIVDAFTARFGASTVTTDRPGAQRRIVWPDPGRAVARAVWEKLKEMHDVVDEPLVHLVGDLTVKAYLLGKTWCVRDAKTGEIRTSHGEHVSKLDPSPTVCVYGVRSEDGACRLVDGGTMDAVGEILAYDLRDLGLRFERSTLCVPATAADGRTDYGFITLPHAVYGAGRDWLNVRCVSSDGGDVSNGDLN